MEVTRANFQEVLEELDEVLKNATFLGIDGEFTGLNAGPEYKPFDTPSQYYQKLKFGSMDFLLIQFGLSVFTYDADTDKYSQRTYNFYVFPKPFNRSAPDCRFMCQASSIDFLASNGFDFNKLFQSGIPYLTANDEKRLSAKLAEKQKLREEGPELITVSEEDKPHIEEICSQIDDFLDSSSEEIMIERCNAYIRRIMCQEARVRWPGKIRLEGKVDGVIQGLMVFKMGSQDEEKKKEAVRREKEQEELKEAVGLSVLLRKIADSDKLIVGHNMLLDLCHIVHQFFGPLPDSYSDFKELIHHLFPKLMDTKILSQSSQIKDLIRSSVLNYMLETVSSPPFSIPEIIPVENRSYNTSTEVYHEAGYDAYVTGLCFIAMANYLGSLETTKVPTVLPDSTLLKPFINKLTMVKLKDYPHVDLVGDDPIPNRNHVFHITFPKDWKLNNLQQVFTPFGGAYVSWLSDTTAYAGLKCKEKASMLLKKIKKNRQLGKATIQTYAHFQASLELPNQRNNYEGNDEGYSKRKQQSTENSRYKVNHLVSTTDANQDHDDDDGWELASGKQFRLNKTYKRYYENNQRRLQTVSNKTNHQETAKNKQTFYSDIFNNQVYVGIIFLFFLIFGCFLDGSFDKFFKWLRREYNFKL